MSTPQDPSQQDQEEDEDSLIPALLAVFAAFMVYRAGKGKLEGGWQEVVKVLDIPGTTGVLLARIANRALSRQRAQAGRAGDELWVYNPVGVYAGQQAGYQIISDALIWLDTHTAAGEDSQSRDHGGQSASTSFAPTPENPPDGLAAMVVRAVAHAAIVAVASMAGWKHKTWHTQLDLRVRNTHRGMQGQKVLIDEKFHSPSGATLMYPGDPTAPLSETASCRCVVKTSRR